MHSLLSQNSGVLFYLLIGILITGVVVKVIPKIYRYFTAKVELDVEGTVVDVNDREIPFTPDPGGGIYPPPLILFDKEMILHEYSIEIENSAGEKLSIEVPVDIWKKITKPISKIGQKIKLHCEKHWDKSLHAKSLLAA